MITDDFNNVVPVEIKAGSTGRLRSLHIMVLFQTQWKISWVFHGGHASVFFGHGKNHCPGPSDSVQLNRLYLLREEKQQRGWWTSS